MKKIIALIRLFIAFLTGRLARYRAELRNAIAARDAGNMKLQAKHLRDAYAIAKDAFGVNSMMTVKAMSFLADVLRKLGETDEADKLSQDALAQAEKLVAPSSTHLPTLLIAVGLMHSRLEHYDQAEEMFSRALRIFEQNPHHRQTALGDCYTNLGSIQRKRGNHAAAIQCHKRAILAYSRSIGEESQGVASALNNLASAHKANGEYQLAADALQKSLDVATKLHPLDHPDFAQKKLNLAITLRYLGDVDRAEPLMNEAAQLIEQKFGPQHTLMAAAQGALAFLKFDQKKFDEAETLAKQSLDLRLKKSGPASSSLADNYQILARIEAARGNNDSADKLFQQARAVVSASQAKEYGPQYAEFLRACGRDAEAAAVLG